MEDALTNIAGALAPGAPLVDEMLPDNLVSHQSFAAGAPDAQFAAAHRVVEAKFAQHRQTHVPIEPSRHRTGRPRTRASAATVLSSRYSAIFWPKPPPMSGQITVTCNSLSPRRAASWVR